MGDTFVRPDIVFTLKRVAVFLDGCYWHMCPEHCRIPNSNRDYWVAKLLKNVQRDARADAALTAEGWRVVRIWEHEEPEVASENVRRVLMGA